MYLYILFFCSCSFTATFHALAEDLDTPSSIFNSDTGNVEGPYVVTTLASPSLGEAQVADASIFDDTSLESSTSETGENLFSAFPGSDDSNDLAFLYSTSALDAVPAASNVLSSVQDIGSKVLFFSTDQWTN